MYVLGSWAAKSTLLCLFSYLVAPRVAGELRGKLLFLQEEERGEDQQQGPRPDPQLLVVTWLEGASGEIGGCEVFDDANLIEEVLNSTSDPQIQKLGAEDIKKVLGNCTEVSMRKKRQADRHPQQAGNEGRLQFPGQNCKEQNCESQGNETDKADAAEGYDGWNVIFPGTKWCGAGDIAANYNDLGHYADTDKCCRAHDLCNDTLAPGETRNNLTNSSPFTTLSCNCDHDFYDCLDRVDSIISNKIGNIYFNILRRDCYNEDYPLTKKCKTFRSFLKITCKEYAKNTSAPKIYQWIKPKTYKKLPIPGPLTVTLPF